MTTNEPMRSPALATLFRHLVNPVVATLLRSPASRLLDANLLLIRYRGRRTGRELELPVPRHRGSGQADLHAARRTRRVSRGNAAGETRPGAMSGSRQPTRSRAREILDERYARGELSTEVDYERLQAMGEATF